MQDASLSWLALVSWLPAREEGAVIEELPLPPARHGSRPGNPKSGSEI